jgi:lysophospholipase L1-like esterase
MNRNTRTIARLSIVFCASALGVAASELYFAHRGYKPSWQYTSDYAQDDLAARYTLKPGIYPNLFNSYARINSLGARGPEPRKPLVLSLGDSCTFGVGLAEKATYAGQLTARGFETINAGVPGYNSYSGLRRLQSSSLLGLHPKLVTLYFGWNDHWRAAATEKHFARLRWWAQYSRTAAMLLGYQQSIWSPDPRWRDYRRAAQVPLEDFKDNLSEMIRLSKKSGAAVVLITPPSEPRLAKGDFFATHSLVEFDDHPRYAEAVRAVAAETTVGLIDLDRELRKRSAKDPHKFFIDFAHLNADGHAVLARMLEPWAKAAAREL